MPRAEVPSLGGLWFGNEVIDGEQEAGGPQRGGGLPREGVSEEACFQRMEAQEWNPSLDPFTLTRFLVTRQSLLPGRSVLPSVGFPGTCPPPGPQPQSIQAPQTLAPPAGCQD